MKASLFLVALLAPVALCATPGVVTVVGDEASGTFSKQYSAPVAQVVYTGVSPVVETSFVPVVYSHISTDDAGAGVYTVVDNSLVQPYDVGEVVPTLYQGGYRPSSISSSRPGYVQGRPTGYPAGFQTGFQTGQTGFHQVGNLRPQGFGNQGFANQGFANQGFTNQGFGSQGFGSQGIGQQGFGQQGFGQQGFASQGFGPQGLGTQGLGSQGFSSSSAFRPGSFQQGVVQTGVHNRPGQFPLHQFAGTQTGVFPGQFASGFTGNQGAYNQGTFQNQQHRPLVNQPGRYTQTQGSLQTGSHNRPGQFTQHQFAGTQAGVYPGQFASGLVGNQGVYNPGTFQNQQHRPLVNQPGIYTQTQGSLQTGSHNRPGQFPQHQFAGTQTGVYPGQFASGFVGSQGAYNPGTFQNQQQPGQYTQTQGTYGR